MQCTQAMLADNSFAQDNLVAVRAAYNRRELSGKFLPVIYQIEPTSLCNLSCGACPNHQLQNKKHMSMEVFKSIIDRISPWAKTIKLSYLGEPLLNPYITNMIQYARDNTTAKLVMFTNGSLLTRKMSFGIIASGLDEIVFSLDAFKKSDFERIRIRSNRDLIWRNIEDFLLFKAERKPKAAINCVCFDLNADQHEQLQDYWREYSCSVVFSPVVTWSGQLGLNGLTGTLKHSQPCNSPKREPCAELWYKAVINVSGDVLLCCNDFNTAHKLGNILEQDFRSVWNGASAMAYREAHRNQHFNRIALCGNCHEWSDQAEMEALLPEGKLIAMRP